MHYLSSLILVNHRDEISFPEDGAKSISECGNKKGDKILKKVQKPQ